MSDQPVKKLNIFQALSHGMALIGDITLIAVAIQSKTTPATLQLATDLFTLLTVDFNLRVGKATPQKISEFLDGLFGLFL